MPQVDAITAPVALDSTGGLVHASRNDRLPPATERHRPAQGERPPEVIGQVAELTAGIGAANGGVSNDVFPATIT
jgi:hypothetical protein